MLFLSNPAKRANSTSLGETASIPSTPDLFKIFRIFGFAFALQAYKIFPFSPNDFWIAFFIVLHYLTITLSSYTYKGDPNFSTNLLGVKP